MTDPEAAPPAGPARWELLDPHLRTARWFGGKGRNGNLVTWLPLPWLPSSDLDKLHQRRDHTLVEPRPPLVEPVETTTSDLDKLDQRGDELDQRRNEPTPRVRSELVQVRYPDDGSSEWYQLLLSYRSAGDHDRASWLGDLDDPELGPVSVHDATADPAALSVLLRTLDDGVGLRGGQSTLVTRSVAPVPAGLVPRRFGGEQTNTSILYGDAAILKLFRRLEPGRNLDIEVHEALAGSGSPVVADFHAAAEAGWELPDGSRWVADLAIVTEQFADARGGWEEAVTACSAGRDFTAAARDLGLALAEVHRLLAQHFPTATPAGDDLASAMQLRLDTAIVEVPQLDPYGPGLRRCLTALAGTDWPAQRVHGDFHLGQVLHTAAGWRIIDFEGEPLKPLAERARPDSPWRDVAGMLRSFDYAGAQAGGASAADWVRDCRAAFLAGYAPDLDDRGRAALRAYEADKAVYEVRYETRNRPDWAAIPLAAVATLSALEPPGSAAAGPSEEIR